MSERYRRAFGVNYCAECGTYIVATALVSHDAFHYRIEMLDSLVRFQSASADMDSNDGERRQDDPDPVCPFPIGAKVRYKDAPDITYTVKACQRITHKDERPWWKVWYIMGGFDDAEVLELVPEPSIGDNPVQGSGNPDTPPSAENPDKPLLCAVCGEPVGVGDDGPYHTRIPTGPDWRHAATLTPPERAEPYQRDTEPPVGSVVRCLGCGNVYVHKADGWVNTDDGSRGLAWEGLQRSYCGPLRVIYGPGEER